MAFMLKRGGFRSAGRGSRHSEAFSKEVRSVAKSGLSINETPFSCCSLRASSKEPLLAAGHSLSTGRLPAEPVSE